MSGLANTQHRLTNQTPCFPSLLQYSANSLSIRSITFLPSLTSISISATKSSITMKREGRQHGSVRSYQILPSPLNPRPESRFVNRFDSPPTTGLFTRVSSKPTNHSKYTGRCGRVGCVGCHLHPASKSKDKAKGTQKLRSSDVVSNHRLVTWRVVDSKPGLKVSGFSATEILDHLDSGDYYMDGDEIYEESCGLDHQDSVEVEISSGAVEIEDKDGDEIEDTSFYDVALVWEPSDVGEEDWCLVGEM